MNLKAGSLIQVISDCYGIYILEENEDIKTRSILVPAGYYIVIDLISEYDQIYAEILYEGKVVLFRYIFKNSIILS
jgi:hypothetical protein